MSSSLLLGVLVVAMYCAVGLFVVQGSSDCDVSAQPTMARFSPRHDARLTLHSCFEWLVVAITVVLLVGVELERSFVEREAAEKSRKATVVAPHQFLLQCLDAEQTSRQAIAAERSDDIVLILIAQKAPAMASEPQLPASPASPATPAAAAAAAAAAGAADAAGTSMLVRAETATEGDDPEAVTELRAEVSSLRHSLLGALAAHGEALRRVEASEFRGRHVSVETEDDDNAELLLTQTIGADSSQSDVGFGKVLTPLLRAAAELDTNIGSPAAWREFRAAFEEASIFVLEDRERKVQVLTSIVANVPVLLGFGLSRTLAEQVRQERHLVQAASARLVAACHGFDASPGGSASGRSLSFLDSPVPSVEDMRLGPRSSQRLVVPLRISLHSHDASPRSASWWSERGARGSDLHPHGALLGDATDSAAGEPLDACDQKGECAPCTPHHSVGHSSRASVSFMPSDDRDPDRGRLRRAGTSLTRAPTRDSVATSTQTDLHRTAVTASAGRAEAELWMCLELANELSAITRAEGFRQLHKDVTHASFTKHLLDLAVRARHLSTSVSTVLAPGGSSAGTPSDPPLTTAPSRRDRALSHGAPKASPPASVTLGSSSSSAAVRRSMRASLSLCSHTASSAARAAAADVPRTPEAALSTSGHRFVRSATSTAVPLASLRASGTWR